jgi:hypothetical protein
LEQNAGDRVLAGALPESLFDTKVLSYQAAITWEPFSSFLCIPSIMGYL